MYGSDTVGHKRGRQYEYWRMACRASGADGPGEPAVPVEITRSFSRPVRLADGSSSAGSARRVYQAGDDVTTFTCGKHDDPFAGDPDVDRAERGPDRAAEERVLAVLDTV